MAKDTIVKCVSESRNPLHNISYDNAQEWEVSNEETCWTPK